MDETLEAKFRVSLEGKEELRDFFDESSAGASRFSANMSRALRGAGGAISSFAGKAGSELQSFAGKELGGSLGSNARGVLQLRDAITQLAVSSGKGGEIVGALKDQIQSTSAAANQLQGDVTEALQAFVERTGDLETARRNIELYGKAATATGAAVKDLSLVGVELSDKLGIKDQAQSFAILASQSKAGAIELKDLATKGPRIFAAAASAGATGETGLREAGALAQVYAKAFGGRGSAASVATAVENTFTDILKKSAKLEAVGIKVNGRDQFEVLKDIIRATGGDKQKLLEVFNARAIRGVDVLAREYRTTGGFATFDKFRDVYADPNLLTRDFATRNATGEAKIRQQQIARQAFFDKFLGGVAEFGAEHATELQLATAGLGVAGKGLSFFGRLGGALGGRVGGAINEATAARVFVTNWPTGWPGGGGSPSLPGGAGPALLSTGGIIAGGAALTGLALGAVAAHDALIDPVSEGMQKGFDKAKADLVAGRKRQVKHWYNFGGASLEDVPENQQAQAARDYAAATGAAPQVNITIHSNEQLQIKGDSGTRDPKVMDRRSGGT